MRVDLRIMTKRFELQDGDVIADETGRLFRVTPLDEDEARSVRGLAQLAVTLGGHIHTHRCYLCKLAIRCEHAVCIGGDPALCELCLARLSQ